jgi:hypothetical protein
MSETSRTTVQPSGSLPASSSKDIDSPYQRTPRPTGPSENTKAVWAVLQQNYPNAFKKVDLNDPGGVWAANLDDLTTREMTHGLKALQRHDDRYMPNAPTCRKIIKEATPPREPTEPERRLDDGRDEAAMLFHRLRNYVWMAYVKRIVLHFNLRIGTQQAERCRISAEGVCTPYEQAWRTETDKGDSTYQSLMRASVKAMLAEWNAIINAPEGRCPVDYDSLYPPEKR